MRLASATDPASSTTFANWLLSVGDGSSNHGGNGLTTLLPSIPLPLGSTQETLIAHVYPGLSTLDPLDLPALVQFFSDRVILAPHNLSVDKVNDLVLECMQGTTAYAQSADTALDDNGAPTDVPTEFLNTLTVPGLPQHSLRLKVGAPLILLRNLAPSDGLCNGTRLIVVHIGRRVLRVLVITGPAKGHTALIPRIKLTASSTLNLPHVVHRTQFPVRLAFSMTINKAQGQSLSHAGLDLTLPCFTHGQLYVGLSRATSPTAVKVLLPGGSDQNGHGDGDGDRGGDGYGLRERQVPNVVFGEVLSAAGLGPASMTSILQA